MTPLQVELILLLVKQMVKVGERLSKVGEMNDDQCRAMIPLIQSNIDTNDEIIQNL